MPVMDIGSSTSGSVLVLRDGTADLTATETRPTKLDTYTELPNTPQGVYICVVLPANSAGTGGTSPTLTIALQDSADGSTFAALNPPITWTASTLAANVSQRIFLPLPPQMRRYVAYVATVGGTTPNWRGVRIFFTPFFEGNW